MQTVRGHRIVADARFMLILACQLHDGMVFVWPENGIDLVRVLRNFAPIVFVGAGQSPDRSHQLHTFVEVRRYRALGERCQRGEDGAEENG